MTAFPQADYKAQARIIKALAHPTRLFILEELSRGERCVCELTAMVGVEMPTISRHLSVLRNVGILEDEKRGLQVFYRLRVPCVLDFFRCVQAVQADGTGNVCATLPANPRDGKVAMVNGRAKRKET